MNDIKTINIFLNGRQQHNLSRPSVGYDIQKPVQYVEMNYLYRIHMEILNLKIKMETIT